MDESRESVMALTQKLERVEKDFYRDLIGAGLDDIKHHLILILLFIIALAIGGYLAFYAVKEAMSEERFQPVLEGIDNDG